MVFNLVSEKTLGLVPQDKGPREPLVVSFGVVGFSIVKHKKQRSFKKGERKH